MTRMKVLIACEFSGIVREAFRAKGHDAWSCDFLQSEKPGQHIQGDVVPHLREGWDLMIAHPPCTYLCSSGLHWNKRRPDRQTETEKALYFVRLLLDAPIARICLENPVGCIGTRIRCYDQKIQPWMFGHDASKGTCFWLKGLPKLRPTKIVPPRGWQTVKYAGDLPLCPDCGEEAYCPEHEMHFAECSCIGPTMDEVEYKTIDGFEFGFQGENPPHPVWGNQTPSGQNKLGPSDTRWLERSKTYQGIAEAMAEQWGKDFSESGHEEGCEEKQEGGEGQQEIWK